MVFRLKLRVNLVSISYWTKFDSNFRYSIVLGSIVLVSFVLGLVQLLNTIEFIQRYELSAIQNGMCYNNRANH